MSAKEVLYFWFEELTPKDWFAGEETLDEEIEERFLPLNQQAKRGELFEWRATLEGRVAEIIVLDQFSRNLYREDGRAYSSDDMALALSQELLSKDGFNELPLDYQVFALMPFMHAESRKIQEHSVELFSEHPEWEENLVHAIKHKEIIDQFGRYPSRNDQIGRQSTPEEIKWLENNDYLS